MRELRGVPIVGRGVASAVPGSQPLQALLRKEYKGKLQLGQLDPIPREEEVVLVPRKRRPTGRRFVAPAGRYF